MNRLRSLRENHMYFKVLGPLELRTPRGDGVPRGPKVRQVLALLAMQANRTLEVDALVEELWGCDPPRTAVNTVRTHLYHLRRILEGEEAGVAGTELLVTEHSGYRLQIEPDQLDLHRFQQYTDEGRALWRDGCAEEAADVLGRALALWRGRCLTNIDHGRLLSAHVSRLNEQRIGALQLRIEADLAVGRHHELVAELRDLSMTHQLDEWFHARLMTALQRCGRRGDALRVFSSLRRVLNEELGVEPSPELQRLQGDVLAGREDHEPGLRFGTSSALRPLAV